MTDTIFDNEAIIPEAESVPKAPDAVLDAVTEDVNDAAIAASDNTEPLDLDAQPADDLTTEPEEAPKQKRTRKSAKKVEPVAEQEETIQTDIKPELANTDDEQNAEQSDYEGLISEANIPDDLMEEISGEGVEENAERPNPQANNNLRIRRPRHSDVVSIDVAGSDITDAAKLRSDLIDLSVSLRNKQILIGKIHGVESVGGSNMPAYATLNYGAYKVIIPVEELVGTPEITDRDYLSAMVTRRLGAEIEYIVKGIDRSTLIAAASRLEAMRVRRREFYLRRDAEGKALLEVGSIAEGRIVCVQNRGAFVELFGVEAFVPITELTHIRIGSALNRYKAGDRILVKIMDLERLRGGEIKLELSAREASQEATRRSLERYVRGNLYAGIVTMISPAGVFVTLDDVTCLCGFPHRFRPVVGSQVCVRISGVNVDRLRLWGTIIR